MRRRSTGYSLRIAAPFKAKVRVRGRIITLRLRPDPKEGGYVVTSTDLRGLNSQGDSVDEAIANGTEAALALLTEPRPRRNA